MEVDGSRLDELGGLLVVLGEHQQLVSNVFIGCCDRGRLLKEDVESLRVALIVDVADVVGDMALDLLNDGLLGHALGVLCGGLDNLVAKRDGLGWEDEKLGILGDPEPVTELSVDLAVDGTGGDVPVELGGNGLEGVTELDGGLLAGLVELDEPDVLGGIDGFGKVLLLESDDVGVLEIEALGFADGNHGRKDRS